LFHVDGLGLSLVTPGRDVCSSESGRKDTESEVSVVELGAEESASRIGPNLRREEHERL